MGGRVNRRGEARPAIVAAFTGLASRMRYDQINARAVAAEAGVARSTVYAYFDSKDHLMLTALAPLLDALASVGRGTSNRHALTPWMAHIWDRRALFRSLLDSPAQLPIRRALAERLGGLDDPAAMLAATGTAAGQLAMLREWMAGTDSLPVEEMVPLLLRPAWAGAPRERVIR